MRVAVVKLLAACAASGVLAAVILAAMFFLQRRVLFPAPRPMPSSEPARGEIVHFSVEPGPAEGLFLPATEHESGPTPLIVFTHGNAELAEQWVDQFAEPRSWGWAVLLVEYPGYGRTAGTPSERSILESEAAAYDWARRDPRVDSARIVAWGRSLGGGPAAWLAAHRPLAGLILESAFTSTRPLAARFLIPAFLVRDPFDNLSALRRYRGPLLVVHGRYDQVVPVAHGRALAAAVPGARLFELPCGHNDCARPWAVVRPFLRGLGSSASQASGERLNMPLQPTSGGRDRR